MSDSFGENPFKSLSIGKLPEKSTTKSASHHNAVKKKNKHAIRGLPEEESDHCNDEERALFLRSVGQVLPTETKQGGGRADTQNGSGAFLLEEHGVLPASKELKKKITKSGCSMKKSYPANTGGQYGEQKDKAAYKEKPLADGKKLGSHKNINTHSASKSSTQGQDTASAGWNSPESGEDDSIFMQAVGGVTPLQGRGRDVIPVPEASTPPPNGQISLQDFMEGKLEFALSFTEEYLEGHVVGLDQMTINKLRAGSFSPEAHLDLHGLNAVQAFEALRGFLRGSWYKGLRTILVVPGRGRNSPDGVGILREKLQSWLTQDPFKRVVLAFCTAQPHDGGPGSVYVLLRKYKKKGHIYWERTPADSDLY